MHNILQTCILKKKLVLVVGYIIFSDKDKEFLKECHKEKIPAFIYLLCAMKNLKDSEIAVLRYWDEFSQVIDKKNFTISFKK